MSRTKKGGKHHLIVEHYWSAKTSRGGYGPLVKKVSKRLERQKGKHEATSDQE
jgi:hypothetical protein